MDLRDEIAARFIQSLDAGIVPWRKPWTSSAARPRNAVTRRPYRGVNALYLGMLATLKGYATGEWLTLEQCRKVGGRVKNGEFGNVTAVIFWKFISRMEDGKRKSFPLCRSFEVYNIGQTEGVPTPEPDAVPDVVPIAEAQRIIDGFANGPKVTISADSDRAFYVPSEDSVTMPNIERFVNAESFYSTMFHELGHATGHGTRLKREGVMDSKGFGSESYSREELIAEITSAFLCAEAGILDKVEANSIAYVAGWASKLKSEPRMVIEAAGLAQRAADLVLGIKFENPSE
jgi:antirestriction protein ArdC